MGWIGEGFVQTPQSRYHFDSMDLLARGILVYSKGKLVVDGGVETY